MQDANQDQNLSSDTLDIRKEKETNHPENANREESSSDDPDDLLTPDISGEDCVLHAQSGNKVGVTFDFVG